MQNTTHDNVILELTVRNHPGVMKVQRNQSDPTMFNKIAVFFQ
ncbi:hypothetical protein ACUWFG_08870 [Escherichia coli]